MTHVTVSRAFSGKDPVAPATRRRIMEAARNLGYRPNTAAKAVRTGRTGFVGMLRSREPWCSVLDSRFEVGVDDALHDRGLCLVRDVLAESSALSGRQAVPRVVGEHLVDGLLVNYAFGTPEPVRELLDRCRVPAIWINCKRPENCVRPNDEGAAGDATRHLLEHGHRRIVFADHADPIHPGMELHYSVLDRRNGYAQAMRQAGLAPQFFAIPPFPDAFHRLGHIRKVFMDWLGRADRPTAVVCGIGGGGRTLLLAAARLGLRVPEDLSVITFDNDAGADEHVEVDRVLVPAGAMGRVAVSELCALMDKPAVPRRAVVIPFEFHCTGTVARPNLRDGS